MVNKNPKTHIGILWADPYCGNLGVAALAYSSVILFEKVADRTGKSFEYTLWGANHCGRSEIVFGNSKVSVRTVRPFLGGDFPTFLRRCFHNPIRIATPIFALDFFRYDLVADIGAGDSYADIYGIERFRNIDFTKQWSRRLHKKYILLPQTLGPFQSAEARKKAAYSMEHADLIFARDSMSYCCAQEMLPQKKIEQTIDVAFFLPYESSKYGSEKIRVGVNISGLLWEGGYTRDNQFGLKADYRQTTLSVLDYFSRQKNVELHLIVHVIADPHSIDEDTHVIEALRLKYPQAIVAPRFKTPVEAKSYISGMDFFTGARMHACIAAISSGVPVYPQAYSRKFNGLFRDTLGYDALGDLKNCQTEEVLAGMCKAFEQREALSVGIKKIIHQVINPEKEKMIEKLSEYVRKL